MFDESKPRTAQHGLVDLLRASAVLRDAADAIAEKADEASPADLLTLCYQVTHMICKAHWDALTEVEAAMAKGRSCFTEAKPEEKA